MGFTRYWKQKRDFTVAQWQQIIVDLKAILHHAQHVEGIALANGAGEGGTSPDFKDTSISFNGLGDDSYETFYISRKREPLESWQTRGQRGSGFCKTERKPYDVVVVACLCYLSTVTRKEDPATHEPIIGSEAFTAITDGGCDDMIAGLDLARAALPQYGNVLDLPMAAMQADRWCGPWVKTYAAETGYEVHFCVDGHGYVLRPRTKESYRFDTHEDLAQWLESTKRVDTGVNHRVSFGRFSDNYRIEVNIWDATGSFDKARHKRLAAAQKRECAKLFPAPTANAHQPPAYVRPGQMPENAGRKFCYSVNDLLNHLGLKAAA